MAAMKCPYCDEGQVKIAVVPEYPTQLGGVPFTVKDARIGQCDTCGRKVFDAKEVGRWEQELRQQLLARGALVRAEQIRATREGLGLGVSEFAFLMGVTRQTVHAWEQSDGGGMQLGPAAMLLGLLADNLAREETAVLEYLVRCARQRGRSIKGISLVDSSAGGDAVAETGRERRKTRDIPAGCPGFGSGKRAA